MTIILEVMQKGILIASDSHTEWLLQWWWKYYSRYNDFPVAIVDFGMTKKMKKWCEQRGQVIPLLSPADFVISKHAISEEFSQQWEEIYKGDVWQPRQAWFKKPLAFLKTPFELTLWIDVDCEVLSSLMPLFDEWEEGIELALVRESNQRMEYNSGVVLFSKNASFLQDWARLCLRDNDKYMGDQNALTDLLLKNKIPLKELDPIYNWLMSQGYNVSAVIAHWCAWGKEHIQKFGGVHDLLKT